MSEIFDVFLSYNSKDKSTVRQIAESLRNRGLKVWWDEWELIPGRSWITALEQIIETVRAAAVCVGKNGFGAWEQPEMGGALMEFIRRGLPVIPILLPDAPDDLKLPLFLKGFTWVNLRGGITYEAMDRLEWGIRGTRPIREEEPARRVISPRLQAFSPPEQTPQSERRRFPDLETCSPIMIADIKRNLTRLKLTSLYEFLDLSPNTSADTLCARANQIYRENQRLGRTDGEASAQNALAGVALAVFSSEQEKEKYDNSLLLEILKGMEHQIALATADGSFSDLEMEALIQIAVKRGAPAEGVRKMLMERAAREGWRAPRP